MKYVLLSQFDSMDIEENVDFLEIYDGGPSPSNSVLVARLTGSDPGRFLSYTSTGNQLFLKLLTDGSVEKTGFRIRWSTGGSELRIYDFTLIMFYVFTSS